MDNYQGIEELLDGDLSADTLEAILSDVTANRKAQNYTPVKETGGSKPHPIAFIVAIIIFSIIGASTWMLIGLGGLFSLFL